MVTFRCLQSGTLITFTHQHDIDSMKGHEGYVRVDEEKTPVKPISQPIPIKKMGRPKKVANV